MGTTPSPDQAPPHSKDASSRALSDLREGANGQIAARSGRENEPECGDLGLRIARDGRWFYYNSPINRPALPKLFATVLKRDVDGVYWLETPVEKGRVIVEDVPFVMVEAEIERRGASQIVKLRSNLDHWVTLDDAHGLTMRAQPEGGEAPYVHVRDGLEGRVLRPVFYQLVEAGEMRVVDGIELWGIVSAGHFFALGPT